ncbi:MAG: hypothetical protein Q8M11_02725 [Sulfuritalea sp.]|nr:hypothetical protein [Sulfuritalea sp.]MDP1984276.1 hypothetical protein [Sulfuritalea sp.]
MFISSPGKVATHVIRKHFGIKAPATAEIFAASLACRNIVAAAFAVLEMCTFARPDAPHRRLDGILFHLVANATETEQAHFTRPFRWLEKPSSFVSPFSQDASRDNRFLG